MDHKPFFQTIFGCKSFLFNNLHVVVMYNIETVKSGASEQVGTPSEEESWGIVEVGQE